MAYVRIPVTGLFEAYRQLLTLIQFPTASPALLRRGVVGLSVGVGTSVGPFFGELRFTQGVTSVLGGQDALRAELLGLPEPFAVPPDDPFVDEIIRDLSRSYGDATLREFLVLGGVGF